ncbi:MAG: ElyC/SanA/YdcF family protein [Crocinitomicaceae bacterium]
MKSKKFTLLFIIIASVFLTVLLCNYKIISNAQNKTFSDVTKIKKNKVGLVLGTAKTLKDGKINLYFQYRIDATVELFKNGKIDFVLISGDNGNKSYDEPTDFKNELIKRGIPENRIYLDYAGFRTLDSVVRAKKIFGQNSITIISQKFHNERAIYLAEHFGIRAVGFNAKDITSKYGIKTKIREYFARTKVFLDILFGVQPKFLGKKVEIK